MTERDEHADGGVFAAFAIPTYRHQWFADAFSACGAEMETLILAWYVLVSTGSAFLTALVGALRFGGTLVAPFVGVVADRQPRRRLIVLIRVGYLAMAGSVVVAGLSGPVPLTWVLVVAGVSGLARPSEVMLRQALIADTVPAALMTNALGLGRTTMEGARVLGPLAGGALLAGIGIAPAYVVVSVTYALAVVFSLRITAPASLTPVAPERPMLALTAGLRYIAVEPRLRMAMLLAFTVNLTAFPLSLGLLPVIARDELGLDEHGFAVLSATVAGGTLTGSVLVATMLRGRSPQAVMLWSLLLWQLLVIAFAYVETAGLAQVLLALIGLATGVGMVAMSVVILASASAAFRGRVMGVRMLAVYGLPLGLLLAGGMLEVIGIRATLLVLGLLGLIPVLVALRRTRAVD